MNHKFVTILLVISMFFSCKEQQPITVTSDNYHDTVDKLTEVMIHDIFSPPVASRLYVYPNIAAYETLNQKKEM